MFSFLTVPFDLCYLIIVLIIWLLFSLKENDENFDLVLPKNGGILILSNLLWKF